ncbi:receptor-like protein EIX2 [Rhodamnia argentea]|uniref:Receptor-like protein EIX2 n=1 Tax=Rhodamnia argentea TaxID=178133 RepID=A0ABM3HEL0_9MYRT|nr:receptor-like protein EIX2 [Rhodamnia argentea]
MASHFDTNFVAALLHALFVIQALQFSHSKASTNISCIRVEREALLKFKQNLTDPWRRLSSWTGEHCCEWEGVECNKKNGHILKLDLNNYDYGSERSLGGKVHPALSELKHINLLDLGSNNFSGHLPNQFGNFKDLESLDLSFNSFSGPIPPTVGQLSSLRHLDLSYNHLSGSIPESIGRLSNLTWMIFDYNRLDGVVNELHLANLTSLDWLSLSSNELVINVSASWVPPFQVSIIDLSSCKVGPEFPNWLRSQRHISTLFMSNASISGEVPHWLPNVLSHIRILDLSGNMLKGDISKIIGEKTPQLSAMLLSRNNLTGDISNSFCTLHELKLLDLSKNQLSGRLPRCWGKSVPSLRWILLGENKLNGPIPSSLCNLEILKFLGLHKNGFNGVLPECLVKLDLHILDLSDNLFTGKIPPFTSEEFEVIDLGRNYFTGDIPLSLCRFPHLHYLSLAHNNLSGGIPPCFTNFSQMRANSNFTPSTWAKSIFTPSTSGYVWRPWFPIMVDMKGTSREFTSTLSYLFSIDLSSNALEGQIPEGLTRLARLQNFNLSRNRLIGKIPSDIGNLTYLESLDLSNNKLSGEVPPSISNLGFLSSLDLSFNSLSGRVPSGNQLSTLDAQSVYRGNDELCGAPLLKACPRDDHNDMDRRGGHNMNEDESHEGDSVVAWFYSGLGPGFTAAFLGFCGILHFKQTWRISYFRAVDRIIEKLLIVKMVILLWFKRAFQF